MSSGTPDSLHAFNPPSHQRSRLQKQQAFAGHAMDIGLPALREELPIRLRKGTPGTAFLYTG